MFKMIFSIKLLWKSVRKMKQGRPKNSKIGKQLQKLSKSNSHRSKKVSKTWSRKCKVSKKSWTNKNLSVSTKIPWKERRFRNRCPDIFHSAKNPLRWKKLLWKANKLIRRKKCWKIWPILNKTTIFQFRRKSFFKFWKGIWVKSKWRAPRRKESANS